MDHATQAAPEPGTAGGLPSAAPAPTGHPAVDDVLATLADVEDLSLAERVERFERAHEALRATLSSAGEQEVMAPGTAPAVEPVAGS